MTEGSLSENRELRFKRIAESRANAVLDKLRLLGNLSNRKTYKYSEKDIAKIFQAINKELKETRGRFSYQKPKKFKL